MSTLSFKYAYIRQCAIQHQQSLVKLMDAKDIKTDFKLGVNHETHSETLHEVVLSLATEYKQDDKVLATMQVQQAGIFTVEGYESEQLDAILKGYCPNLLFPYLRQTAIVLSQQAGFSTIELPLMDFNAIYQQQKLQAQQKAEATQQEQATDMH